MAKKIKRKMMKESSGSRISLKAKVIAMVLVPLVMVISLALFMTYFISSMKELIELEQEEMINEENKEGV